MNNILESSFLFKGLSDHIHNAQRILLFAHKSPDSDTIGSVSALRLFLIKQGKHADIACFDPFPLTLRTLVDQTFHHPDKLDMHSYDMVIACDSVERGFHLVRPSLLPHQVVALLDHHPDITMRGDITIIDPTKSSTCEIVYDYFVHCSAPIDKSIASALLLGILGDTGNLQHANTSTHVLNISADLLSHGAPINKIAQGIIANKKITTLQLWGKAFSKARIKKNMGMIVTALTQEDMRSCNATSEDISQVANMLATVPGVRFALILAQKDTDIIKGSFRSEEKGNVDVSSIAAKFGGGGHKLASGFEMRGRLYETPDGWMVR